MRIHATLRTAGRPAKAPRSALIAPIILGLFIVLIPFEYLRVALFAYGIDPPLIKGLHLVSYFLIGSAGLMLLAATPKEQRTQFHTLLILLLCILFLAPMISGTILRPQHGDSVLPYVILAFGNAVFVAFGYLSARQNVALSAATAVWAAMTLAAAPAFREMMSLQFGAATVFARAGMHITLGDLYMFATLFLISSVKTMPMRLAVFAIGVAFLVAIGSRTALYAYVLALPIILLRGARRTPLWALAPSAVLVLGGASSLALELINPELARETRMFSFFVEGNQDTAWLARIRTLQDGLIDIQNHVVFGSFRSDLDRFGTDGLYIHNYLEMWRQFGIVPFGLFVVLIAQSLAASLGRQREIDRDLAFTIILFLVPLLAQIALSRSYGYPQIFFVFGMVSFLLSRQKKQVPALTTRTTAPENRNVLQS